MRMTRNLRRQAAVTAGLVCVLGFSAALACAPAAAWAEVPSNVPMVAGSPAADIDVADGRWVVTDEYTGDLQRYWIHEDGSMARGELLWVSEGGSEYFAYATPEGPVVRGRWADPETGYVYLADNDGRLEDAGWLVTDEYGDGIQRYWVDAEERACVPGFSSEGYDHYTTAAGYVLRGRIGTSNGVIIADNDGLLAESLYSAGIVDTDRYDSVETRYSFVLVGGHLYAQVGFFAADISGGRNWCFADEGGRVLRGKLLTDDGMLVADSEGALIENYHSAGMTVTDVIDGHLERYYLENVDGHLYARVGLFSYEGSLYYGLTSEGYLSLIHI